MLTFLKDLISLNTNSLEAKNYIECANLIKSEAEKLGFNAELIFSKPNKPNVLVNIKVGAAKTLLINAHFDIVPAGDGWKTNPFELVQIGNKLYGRGVADDKGAIAASLYSLSESKPTVNVKLLFTCDEEIGGEDGLGFCVTNGYADADAALILDGPPVLAVASSGVIQGKLRIYGKGGHASMPFAAKNPVHKLIDFLFALKNYEKIRKRKISPFLGIGGHRIFGRFSITMLHGSEKENVIPSEAFAGFDLRVNPEESKDEVISDFENFVKKIEKEKNTKVFIEYTSAHSGHVSKGAFIEKMKIITDTKENYATWGGNDGHFLAKKMEVACFGITSIKRNIHAPNEFIFLSDLEMLKKIVKKVVEEGW